MKIRKMLALLITLAMALSCLGVTAWAEDIQAIGVNDYKYVTISASDSFVDEYVYYSFTPDVSGTYAFCCEADELYAEDAPHQVWVDVEPEVPCASLGNAVLFAVEAGQTYTLCANIWGTFEEDLEYILGVLECHPAEAVCLMPESDQGNVGDVLCIDLLGDPILREYEECTWTVSDPKVAEIEYSDWSFCALNLLNPGTVTVSVETESGLTDRVEITVVETEYTELAEGENIITVSPCGVAISFTPERDGYYTVDVPEGVAACWLDADTVGDEVTYRLEAGVTYTGGVYSWMDEDVDVTVLVQYVENVTVKTPVGLELVSLPDNTTYLSSCLTDLEFYIDYTGLVMNVLWDDGTVTSWSAQDDNWVGGCYIDQELAVDGNDAWVEISVADVEPVVFRLTILDITAESIALVDETPVKLVEHSCGLDLGVLDASLEGWYYIPVQAYTREVVITFSDGSTVNAMPGECVYGILIEVADNQLESLMSEDGQSGFWTKDSENYLTFFYEDVYADLAVEIVDSPVASIELVTPPKNNVLTVNDEFDMVNKDGEIVASVRDLFEGMSLKVTLKDGSSKTFGPEEIEWVVMDGDAYPMVDGYPVGVFGGLMSLLWEEAEIPCDLAIVVEYMGAETSYTLSLVEEGPEIEPNPETGDVSLLMPVILMMTAMLTVAVLIRKKEY